MPERARPRLNGAHPRSERGACVKQSGRKTISFHFWEGEGHFPPGGLSRPYIAPVTPSPEFWLRRWLGWMSVQQLIEYSTLCATHKILVTDEPEYPRGFNVNRDAATRVTRQADYLHVARARTKWGKASFIYSDCELYNERA